MLVGLFLVLATAGQCLCSSSIFPSQFVARVKPVSPALGAVLELNPSALEQAASLDSSTGPGVLSMAYLFRRQPAEVEYPRPRQPRPIRSAIIALAMQLWPGSCIDAGPAWVAHFLMPMTVWPVLISGSGEMDAFTRFRRR